MRAAAAALIWLVLAGAAPAESWLPAMPLNVPEAGFLDEAQTHALQDAIDRLIAIHDTEAAVSPDGPLPGLAAEIGRVEADLAARFGPASRALAQFLAETLWLRERAAGWDAMSGAAIRAVAMERQLSANAELFGNWFGGGFEAAATADQTEALQAVLTQLSFDVKSERAAGEASPTRSEELAFRLAQAGFTGDTARAAVRPLRLDPLVTVSAPDNRRIDRMRHLYRELWVFGQLVEAGTGFPDAAAVEASSEAALAEVESDLGWIAEAGIDVADVFYPGVFGIADIQRSLGPDEAVVMFAPAGPVTLIFAVTQDRFQLAEVGIDPVQLIDATTAFREAIGMPQGRGAVPIDPRPTRPEILRREASRLYAALFGPVEAVIRDRTRLFVVGTGDLGPGLPLEVLLTTPAPPGAADRDLDWLVRRHAVTVVPALELVWARTGFVPPPEKTYYLGFGAPSYAEPSVLGRRNWATRLLGELRPLADSAAEVETVAAAFGPQNGMALTGADASEYMVLEASASGLLRRFTVLHFATHGLINGDHPDVGAPLIALTPTLDLVKAEPVRVGGIEAPVPDGVLEAHEVRQLDLAARLVILSACSSGRIIADEDGLASLGADFLYAGAERVLGTHWPIYSDAAVAIVTGMAARDPAMADPAMALRATLLDLIAEGGRHADPAWWAAFSLVGRP